MGAVLGAASAGGHALCDGVRAGGLYVRLINRTLVTQFLPQAGARARSTTFLQSCVPRASHAQDCRLSRWSPFPRSNRRC